MKKVILIAAIVALAFSSMACGSGPKLQTEKDSLSYCVGASLGLNVNLGLKDLELDQDLIVKHLKDVMANGDINSDEFKTEKQKMDQKIQMFQYIKLMPYMRAKQMREMSEQPDTLPALPELYDNEEYTREEIARCFGSSMGAYAALIKDELDMKVFESGLNDGLKVEDAEKIDEQLKLTQEQMQQAFMGLNEKMMKKEQEEYEAMKTKNAEESAAWLAEVEKMEGVQKTESGILYRIDREGTGKQATKDEDVVKVNYEGKLRDGKIFDSSYERGEAIEFPLNGVIKGWTEGMKLVKTGGQITLWIPAELAYGERGAGQDIGPNCALEFKVELLEVNPVAKK